MLLEICASNYQSAINAQKAGAHRIELCSELAVGGLTPSKEILQTVLAKLNIPVFVLIRPRSGNFSYSPSELETMKKDILVAKDLGCSGIVSGILTENGTIAIEKTKQLMVLSRPLPFTFHRAFDEVPDPFEALDQLMELGVERLLTSGQAASADKGLELLKQLKDKAKNRTVILPGGGINPLNASLFKTAGFGEIHTSATTKCSARPHPKMAIGNGGFLNQSNALVSDVKIIKGILKAISS